MKLVPCNAGGYFCREDPGEPSTGNPRVSIGDDDVTQLIKLFVGMQVLDIGTGLGVSARALARVATLVVTTDIDPWVNRNVEFEEPNIVSIPRPDLAGMALRYEGAFIDGAHDRSSVRADIDFALSLRSPGRPFVLAVHDWKDERVRNGAVGHPFEWIRTNYGIGVARLQ